MAKLGMSREKYEHICKYIHLLELDLKNGTICNRKSNALTSYGYLKISLACKPVFQHQIFAVARWGEKCIGMTVNHINGCRTDNRWDNLELLSHEDNVRIRTNLSGSCKTKQPIEAINLDTGETLNFKSIREAERQLGIYSAHISKVVNGKWKRAGRYIFKKLAM